MTAARPRRKPPPRAPLLRIGELARRAGVTRPTIQHYVHEGLLPAPRKTGRTMAWYEPACVARILLIKELQKRYLPLGVIRDLLAPPGATAATPEARLSALVATSRGMQPLLAPPDRALGRDEVEAATGVTPHGVAELERVGLVAATGGRFDAYDAGVLRAVGRLLSAGLDEAAGFRFDDLLLYRESLAALLGQEVALFSRHLLARTPVDLLRLGIAAAEGSTGLIAALHLKMVAEFVRSIATEDRPPERRRRKRPRR